MSSLGGGKGGLTAEVPALFSVLPPGNKPSARNAHFLLGAQPLLLGECHLKKGSMSGTP